MLVRQRVVSTGRPLDRVPSIKAKLGLLVGASIVAASLVSEIGDRAGVSVWLTVPVTVAAALGVTQWLARGMTSPLREMTTAAAAMATGDYSRRVRTGSADEVGQLATAFNTMATDLATAEQQRRQRVATVSHALRTPLTAQRALLENLVDGVVRPDDDVLRAALAQAERLSTLVEDLLDLSRVDGGRARLRLEPVEVGALAERCVAEARVAGRSLRHVVDVPAPLVPEVDPARLAQVLANLLDNAGRHSPPDGVVTVRAGRLDDSRWFLEVEDEGPGIPGERAEKVFERFGTWDDSGGGTGIGLAIASWVCELHGGSIGALPARGGGTRGARVRAVLPLRPVELGAAPRAPAATAFGAGPAEARSPDPTIRCHHPAAEEGAMSAAEPPVPSIPAPGPRRPLAAPRPLVESLFGDLWPEAGLSPRTGLLLGSIGVGALAAVVLPFRDVGLALLLVLIVAGGLVLSVARRRTARWTMLSAVAALGLAGLTVLRAAEWLTVLAMVAVVLLGATALTGSRGFLSFLGGVAAWPLSALRGLPLLGRTISAMSRLTFLWPVVRTAAISLVVLVVFGGLFASGDAIFGSWAQALVPDLAWDSLTQRSFVGFVVGGTVLAASYLAINPPRVDRLVAPPARPVTRLWEWVVPVGVLVAVFVAFVLAQATALFGGHDHIRRTTGLTYAEYVHQGFWQLTVATVLTLVTIAIAVRKAPRTTSRERLVMRLVLGALCLLTLVVVASALHRMDLYQQAYGYTVLRVLVGGFEVWLGLLVVLVAIAGIHLSGAWLPRAALLSFAVFLLLGGLANPEAWVAQRNIERYQSTGRLDVSYLSSLGPDAAPTIRSGLPQGLSACIISSHGLPGAEDTLSWNLGRARAHDLGSDPLPGFDQASCTVALTEGVGG
jgi:signal transduction histidine kinase